MNMTTECICDIDSEICICIEESICLCTGDCECDQCADFTMNGCPYCKEFDNIWEDLIPSIPKLTTEKSEDQQKIEELNINSFPTILLMKKNKPIQFKENRDIPTIHRFLKKNVSSMV